MSIDHSLQYLSGLRLIHNIINISPIDIYIDNKPFVINLAYQNYTNHISLGEGKHEIVVFLTATDKLITKAVIDLVYDNYYTMMIADNICELFRDIFDQPPNDYAFIRFIHQNTNIYVYINDVRINSHTNHVVDSTYYPIKVGQLSTGNPYHICIKITSTKSSVVLGSASLFLMSGDIYTLVTSLDPDKIKLDLLYIHDNKNESEELQPDFDIKLFMGKWYYICSISSDTNYPHETIEYKISPVNNISVCNIKYDKTWNDISITYGAAIVINPYEPAMLEIDYPDNLSKVVHIIHKTDYTKYAIIGSINRTSFYILCRTPKMCVNQYVKFMDYAKSLGYHKYMIKNYHLALTELGCDDVSKK